MGLLILGASGRTGSLIAQSAVVRGHRVNAIVRDNNKKRIPGVNYFVGSPLDSELLNKAIEGTQTVVVALNINRTSDNPFAKVISPLALISDTILTLLPIMKHNNVRRLITISASGVGDSWKHLPLPARWFIRSSNIWKAYEDHDRQEKIIRLSNLDWTIVRPVMLNNKDSDAYLVTTGKPSGGRISRKGVAKFIIDILESEDYIDECVTLYS